MKTLLLLVPVACIAALPARAQLFTLEAPAGDAEQAFSLGSQELVPTLAGVEAQSRALDARQDLSEAERERERARLQRDYEIAMRLLEMQKLEEERKAEASKQGAAFTKEFLQLDPTASDFPAKFKELEERFPLAVEEPLSRKLIERARRNIAREEAESAASGEPTTGEAPGG